LPKRAGFEPKFPDCTGCRFYRASLARPECLECGSGEFFEPKTRHLEAGADPDAELDEFLKGLNDYD